MNLCLLQILFGPLLLLILFWQKADCRVKNLRHDKGNGFGHFKYFEFILRVMQLCPPSHFAILPIEWQQWFNMTKKWRPIRRRKKQLCILEKWFRPKNHWFSILYVNCPECSWVKASQMASPPSQNDIAQYVMCNMQGIYQRSDVDAPNVYWILFHAIRMIWLIDIVKWLAF